MPKAASPVRLQQELMQAAALSGGRFHRSTAEQIEYWAEIGRQVANLLDPDTLLAIAAGLARNLPVSGGIYPQEEFPLFRKQQIDGTPLLLRPDTKPCRLCRLAIPEQTNQQQDISRRVESY